MTTLKLVDLQPVFPIHGGLGVSRSDTGEPIAETKGVGVIFDCPCGNHAEEHRCYVPFANPIGPGPYVPERGWHRTGDTFETLTLTPSILRIGACGWHGHIINGEVRTA